MKHYYEVNLQNLEDLKKDLTEIATSDTLREEDEVFFLDEGNLYSEKCIQYILIYTDIVRGREKLLFKLNDYRWFMNCYNKN